MSDTAPVSPRGEYIIIHGLLNDVESSVTKKLNNGWKLVGQPFFWSGHSDIFFHQAMVRWSIPNRHLTSRG